MVTEKSGLNESRVLLTGGQGFVGTWLKEALTGLGVKLTLLVRDIHPIIPSFDTDSPGPVQSIVYGRVEDRSLIERIMLEHEIEYCFHLAAQSLVGKAQASPRSTFVANALGTLNILEAARKSKSIQGLIVASTDKVYGEPKHLPLNEDDPLDPRSIYESTKACGDMLSRAYFESYGLPVGILRCTNIYGGRDMNFSRIIPSLILSFLRNRRPTIESDGTPVRDYLYASDAVKAYLDVAKCISKSCVKGQAFNFGTGKPTSVREMVSTVRGFFSEGLEPVYLNRPGGIQAQYASYKKAKETLGWEPGVDLKVGLQRTIEWYKKYDDQLD